MKGRPLVSIVIPNFNGRQILYECLLSLKNLSYSEFEVIVVDNSSADGSAEMVRNIHPWVRLLETERVGISEACNRGMRMAKGDIIVTMLNNDMTVDKYWLDHIVQALRSEEVGVVCGKIYQHGTNLIQAAGGSIDWNTGVAWQVGYGEEDKGQYDSPREVDYVDVPTLRRDVIDEIGGYDEEYYLYYVDVDYCVKAQMAGYKVLYVPGAVLWHRTSATVGAGTRRQYYYLQRNGWRFLIKYTSGLLLCYRLYRRMRYVMKRLVLNLFRRKIDLVTLQIAAILWNLINFRRTARSRNRIFNDFWY